MCHYYYEELSTGFFPWEKYPVKSHSRSQTSNIFVRICADPMSADFCIVLVLNFASFLSLIPSCFKWPASFFDTEPNAPTTTGTTFVLFLLYLYNYIYVFFPIMDVRILYNFGRQIIGQ